MLDLWLVQVQDSVKEKIFGHEPEIAEVVAILTVYFVQRHILGLVLQPWLFSLR